MGDGGGAPPPSRELDGSDLVLAELVSRVLDRGVVVAGDVTISVAGVDLVHLGLNLRIASTETLLRRGRAEKLPARTSTDASGEKDRCMAFTSTASRRPGTCRAQILRVLGPIPSQAFHCPG